MTTRPWRSPAARIVLACPICRIIVSGRSCCPCCDGELREAIAHPSRPFAAEVEFALAGTKE